MRIVDESTILTGSLVRLIEVLRAIEPTAHDAKLNEESIDDGSGGRIVL